MVSVARPHAVGTAARRPGGSAGLTGTGAGPAPNFEQVTPWLDRLVRPDGWLYVESEAAVDSLGAWRTVKQGRAGQVHFHLMRRSEE